MSRLLYVRSPEASFRPEKYISDQLIATAERHFDEIVVIRSDDEFTKLDNQRLFYDDTSMTRSFATTALEVTRQARDGDYVFFGDAWNPMIPAIDFHLHCSSVNVRKYGIFHSSVHTPGDFLATTRGGWASKLEALLIGDLLDGVFVATEYSRRTIAQNPHLHGRDMVNVHVTGLPLVEAPPHIAKELSSQSAVMSKDKSVVFAHRWAADKRPEAFLELARLAALRAPDLRFRVLHPVPIADHAPGYSAQHNVEFVLCRTREEYWHWVSKAHVVVSTAELETFGYAILDGCMYGALPFVPKRACYPHMYDSPYIYADGASVSDMLYQLATIADSADQIYRDLDTQALALNYSIFKPAYRDLLQNDPAETIIRTILGKV